MKGIGGSRDEDQEIEKRERGSDVPGANTGDSGGIGERADEMNHEGQRANDDKVSVHKLIVITDQFSAIQLQVGER